MSVCFYNTKGTMGGVDFHLFQSAAPPSPVPVPIPLCPHLVGVPLSWGFCSEKSKLAKVTSDGAPMLQKGHKLKMVPHFGIGVPHLLEALQIAAVIAGSSTTCVMGVASVTGGGESLATCLGDSIGANLDCSSPVDIPSGIVHSPNTVRTTPSTADHVNAGIDLAVSALEKTIELLAKKPDGKNPEWIDRYKTFRERQKNLDQILKHIQRKLPNPTDLVKQITREREKLIRHLLGGHQ